MADFLILAAETMKEKADKEASAGLENAEKTYKLAADKYCQLAKKYPDQADAYFALSKECAEKAKAILDGKVILEKKDEGAISPKPFINQESSSADVIMNEALEKLDGLVGLDSVKLKTKTWVNIIRLNERRKKLGLAVAEGLPYHLVFVGNSGTGKSTVAKLMAKFYYALGILPSSEVVEVSPNELVVECFGQTAIKTKELIDTAMGKILFIDEAYMLSSGFGKEAWTSIMEAMENHRGEFAIIFSGSTKYMPEFLCTNPGLFLKLGISGYGLEEDVPCDSGLGNLMWFNDYTPEELYQIFQKFCEKPQYDYAENVERALKEYFKGIYENAKESFGNAHGVRNLFQDIIEKQVTRLAKVESPMKEDLSTFCIEDLPF